MLHVRDRILAMRKGVLFHCWCTSVASSLSAEVTDSYGRFQSPCSYWFWKPFFKASACKGSIRRIFDFSHLQILSFFLNDWKTSVEETWDRTFENPLLSFSNCFLSSWKKLVFPPTSKSEHMCNIVSYYRHKQLSTDADWCLHSCVSRISAASFRINIIMCNTINCLQAMSKSLSYFYTGACLCLLKSVMLLLLLLFLGNTNYLILTYQWKADIFYTKHNNGWVNSKRFITYSMVYQCGPLKLF